MDQKPWIVNAVFPGHAPRAIARTCHKADAEAHVRFLQRYMSKQGSFSVSFDESGADESGDNESGDNDSYLAETAELSTTTKR